MSTICPWFASILLAVTPTAPTASIDLTVAVQGKPLAADAQLWAKSPDRQEPVLLGAPASGKYVVPGAGLWTLTVTGSGVWSSPVDMIAPGRAELRVEPGKALRATLRPPAGKTRPDSALLRLAKCDSNTSIPEASCPIDAEGSLNCAIPLGCLDARIKFRGFASHYAWGLRSEAGAGAIDLGTIALRPGASVSGWVATEDGRPFDESLEVTMQPQGLHDGARGLTLRLASTALATAPDRGGFFQLSDVSPGDYELSASQTGYGTVVEPLVRVREGLETALPNPLLLTSPRTASFQVSPPVPPEGGAWRIRLAHQRPTGVQPLDEKLLDETGYVSFENLVPGKYGVNLIGSKSGSSVTERQIEVQGPSELFPIDLDMVEVDGRAFLGEDPLPRAELVFGGRTGSVSVSMTTDEDGRFRGALPREGRWKVDLSTDELGIQRSMTNVEVRRRKGRQAASVEIRLTDGRLAGTVVDEAFVPQDKALVELRPAGSEEGPVAIRSEENGLFELRGLPLGPATIRAAAKDAESDPESVTVGEGPDNRMQIVVRKKRPVRGRVLDRSGPVVAANLFLRELGGVMQRGSGAISEVDGTFEALLPRDVSAIHARVGSPGRTLYVGRRDLRDGEELSISLAREGGTLEVLYPPDLWEQVFFIHDGGSSWYGPFQTWAALLEAQGGVRDIAGGRLVIPQLAPGAWHACLVESGSAAWLRVAVAGVPDPSRCRRAEVGPGGVPAVDLRALEGSRRAPESASH